MARPCLVPRCPGRAGCSLLAAVPAVGSARFYPQSLPCEGLARNCARAASGTHARIFLRANPPCPGEVLAVVLAVLPALVTSIVLAGPSWPRAHMHEMRSSF